LSVVFCCAFSVAFFSSFSCRQKKQQERR
jgi:hypothetical protein